MCTLFIIVDIDDCVDVHCNNGACIDFVNGYSCSCNDGFQGENCQGILSFPCSEML